jgi:hypothetical protein
MASNLNQNRIEGTFAIVSAFQRDKDHESNLKNHFDLIDHALSAGIPVEVLHGRWDGEDELSMRLHGVGASDFACRAAILYQQDAFITASNGVATMIDCRTGAMVHFKEAVEVADESDNYSETMTGFRFRFR